MKRLFIFALTALSMLGFGQVKLRITQNGQVVGTASLSAKIAADGTKTDEMSITLTVNGKRVDLRTRSSFDAGGRPTRKFQALSLAGTSQRHQVIVTFGAEGAHVQFLPVGEKKDQSVARPVGADIADPSEFWFIRDHPKKGAKVTCFVFDPSKVVWLKRSATYTGDQLIAVGDGRIRSHAVEFKTGDTEGTAYLDDKGLPLRMEQGNLVFERINP